VIKKVLTCVAVFVIAGALARGGELFDIRVEAGVEIGHQAHEIIDGDLDYNTTVFLPYLQVSRFGNGPCFSARLRGLFAIDEDTEVDDLDAETQTDGFDFQALFGWGLAVPKIKLCPVVGLAFRKVTTESDLEDADGSVDYDFDALFLEVGARAEASLGKIRAVAQLTVGPVITGETNFEHDAADISDDADIGFFEGYHMELRGGIDYKLNSIAAVHLGAAYERFADETDDFSDIDENSEDELDRLTFNIGIVVTF
jgi:hypothetical protein